MKKLLAIVVAVILASGVLCSGNCYAGEKEWATAGKILTGIVAAQVLSDWAYRRPYYYSYSYPVYAYPVYRTYGYRTYRHHRHHRPRCYTRCTTYCSYPYYEYWY